MNNNLSPTMKDAVSYAEQHGGKLSRFPGGFWGQADWKGPNASEYFATPTIQALISRGVAEYTDWQDHKSGGRFPIEVTLKTQATKSSEASNNPEDTEHSPASDINDLRTV